MYFKHYDTQWSVCRCDTQWHSNKCIHCNFVKYWLIHNNLLWKGFSFCSTNSHSSNISVIVIKVFVKGRSNRNIQNSMIVVFNYSCCQWAKLGDNKTNRLELNLKLAQAVCVYGTSGTSGTHSVPSPTRPATSSSCLFAHTISPWLHQERCNDK